MQSKTSFSDLINKAILKKNTKRFWPIWSLYTLISLVMFPAVLYFENVIGFLADKIERQRLTLNCLYFDLIPEALGLGFIFSIVVAVCVFGYMDDEISCNMYHSLPITRNSHYVTGYVSGLLMMFIPNLIMFVLSSLVMIRFEVTFLVPMLTWLAIITVEELFFFSLASLCVILTGHTFVAIVAYLGISFFVNIVITVINSIYCLLFIGFDDRIFHLPGNFLGIISPVYFFSTLQPNSYNPYKFGIGDVYGVDNFATVMITALVAIVILISVGLWAYRTRKSESAGEIISISWLKPIFRVVFSYIMGSGTTAFIVNFLFNELKYTGDIKTITASLLVIFSVMWFLIAQMILTGSFRIFNGFLKSIAVFAGCTILIVAASLIYGNYAESYVPDSDKVEEVRFEAVNIDAVVSEQNVINDIRDFHKYVVDNSDILADRQYKYDSKVYCRLIYFLNDGSEVERVYFIPVSVSEMNEKFKDFMLKTQTELFLGCAVNKRTQTKVTAYNYIAGTDNSVVLTRKDDINEVIDAIVADIKAGNTNILELFDIDLDLQSWSYIYEKDGTFYAYSENNYAYDDEKSVYGNQSKVKDIVEFLFEENRIGQSGYRNDFLNLMIDEKCTNVLEVLGRHGF